MAKPIVPQGTIGCELTVTIKDQANTVVNISSATVKKIYIVKANKQIMVKTAVFVTDGTDGKLKYVTVAGDLDAVGDWKFHGYVEINTGKFPTTFIEFTVTATAIVS